MSRALLTVAVALAAVALAVVALAAAPLAPAAAGARQPLVTAIQDPAGPGFREPHPARDYSLVRSAGARVMRMGLTWAEVAPTRPAKARNPRDPAYRWAELDARVRLARRRGLSPLLYFAGPPAWAGPAGRPSTSALRSFATALARRYDGRGGRPRASRFQVWNEPNLDAYLDQAGGASRYRLMVNAFAKGVKSVRRSNLVVAGGLGPFGGAGTLGSARGSYGTRPLPFMRRVLCLPARPGGSRPCHDRVRFDAWSHHPYTSGGPTRHALQPGDVSLGDLSEMRAVLDRAWRVGSIRAPRLPAFWVTEFSWDTNPPDGGGVPLALHGRWVSEALYRMWRARVSLVTWFQLRDEVVARTPSGIWQSGLYFVDGRAKPALTAFRFPFVAFTSGRKLSVWGRTPAGDARRVRIEQRSGAGWRLLSTVRSDRHGIFSARTPKRGGGEVRARAGAASLPFSLVRPPDRSVNPFGTGAAPE